MYRYILYLKTGFNHAVIDNYAQNLLTTRSNKNIFYLKIFVTAISNDI